MLCNSEKLSNKNKSTVNEITKNLTTVLGKIQDSNSNLKKDLEAIKIEGANEITINDNKKCYLVQVNESSIKNLQNVHSDIVKKLEDHFNVPVLIVPYRKTINGNLYRKYIGKATPRTKTLTAVYDNLLEDLLYPATIVGRRTRFQKGKNKLFKVHVDPIDKESVEYKANAIATTYKALTNRELVIEFPSQY
jgi:small subunit ribosomal protein S7e